MALAPVPTTATLRPVRSWSCRHWAEWNVVPSNVSSPGISGMWGLCKAPAPAPGHARERSGRRSPRRPRCRRPRRTTPRSPRCRSGCAGPGRSGRRVHAGSPRSPAVGRRSGSSAGSGRRRTSTSGGHVAGATRVGVVTPGATEVVFLLQDHEVVASGLLQLDRHPESGEPAADHHRVENIAHRGTVTPSYTASIMPCRSVVRGRRAGTRPGGRSSEL